MIAKATAWIQILKEENPSGVPLIMYRCQRKRPTVAHEAAVNKCVGGTFAIDAYDELCCL